MGVKGLTQLIEDHPRVYRDEEFRKRRLVIDGCNLFIWLYFDSGLDRIRGGEYAAFEAVIERFVKTLRDCGIDPYVVLDGGKDLTDKKDETLRLRFEDLIKKACQAAEENKQEKVLPRMANLVFRQTLTRLGVPMAQCYTEADWEIAALAKEWQCPVLSNDSDFFICELPGGLLPLSHFQWEDVKKTGSQSFIPCKIYHSTAFCIIFEIQPQLLPAFASLAGNDYVSLERMNASINWAQFAPAVDGTPPHYLEGLLHWLKKFRRPEEAIQAALGLRRDLKKEKREEVKTGLNLGMEVYQLPPSSLEQFFSNKVTPSYPEAVEKNAGWTLRLLMEGQMTSEILDVLLLHCISLSLSVDRGDKPSANLTSRPIRQVMYRLLLGQDKEVEEKDREDRKPTSISVKPEASGIALQLKLQTLNKEEPSVRLQVLLEALRVSEVSDSLKRLHHQRRLLVAATCFWLQQAKPKPDDTLLMALLLMALLLRPSHKDSIREIKDQIPLKQQLDTDVLHSLNQWQACLQHSVYLNQLLDFPLPEPRIAQCYEGTLVHRLVQMMRANQNLEAFLKSDPSSMEEYNNMLAVTQRFCSKVYMMNTAPQREVDPSKATTSTQRDLSYQYKEDEVSSEEHQEPCSNESLKIRFKTRYTAKGKTLGRKRKRNHGNSQIILGKKERRDADIY